MGMYIEPDSLKLFDAPETVSACNPLGGKDTDGFEIAPVIAAFRKLPCTGHDGIGFKTLLCRIGGSGTDGDEIGFTTLPETND